MPNVSYPNEDLIDAVDRIRLLNGEEPISYRGNEGPVLVFQNSKRKKIYYSVPTIIKFIEDAKTLDDMYLGVDRIR